MDSHCPWVYNCIGVNNHRHFFLYLIFLEIGVSFLINIAYGCKCYFLVHMRHLLTLLRLHRHGRKWQHRVQCAFAWVVSIYQQRCLHNGAARMGSFATNMGYYAAICTDSTDRKSNDNLREYAWSASPQRQQSRRSDNLRLNHRSNIYRRRSTRSRWTRSRSCCSRRLPP